MFKKTCASCHYLVRVHHPDRAGPFTLEISREARERSCKGDLSWQRPGESLACHRGIWDEGVGFHESSAAEQVAKLSRSGRCYYLKYQPGMLLPAAEKLQEQQVDQTRELQKLRFAVYALFLTIVTLLAKLLLG